MHDYPPKLVAVEETDFGLVLVFTDGARVPTDVKPERLAEALVDAGRGTLAELPERWRPTVYPNLLLTDPAEWDIITRSVRTSLTAAGVLREHPAVRAVFSMPHGALTAMPHRIYGGLDQVVYTSHPVLFRDDPNRPPGWRRSLLNARGGWVFQTWVELRTVEVEVAAEVLPGHFLE